MNKNNRNISVINFDAAFPPPIIGGKEKQAYILAQALSIDNSINVGALSFDFENSYINPAQNFDTYRIRKSKFYLLTLIKEIILKRYRFSIMHIHTPSKIGVFVGLISRIFLYKVFFKIPNQGIKVDISSTGILNYLFFTVVPNKIIILEKETLEKYSAFKLLRNKIFFVPNGVEKRKIKQYRDISNYVRFIFVGRLVPQKGCQNILKLCLKLKFNNHKFHLDILGHGPEYKNIKIFIDENGLSDNVTLHGNVNDPIKLMYESDILISSSYKEGMSNVVLEAMSIGLPVIASKVGSIDIQLGKFYKSYTCEIDDIHESLFLKYLSLRSNKKLEEYGEYLHSRCSRHFSIEHIADLYKREYSKHAS